MCSRYIVVPHKMQAQGTMFRHIRQLSVTAVCEHKWCGMSCFVEINKAYISTVVWSQAQSVCHDFVL